jgi:glutamine transport system substrate-binding protein
MAFAELLPALRDGRLDAALGALSITAKREKRIDFSYPYYDAGLILMVKKANPFIRGIGDLDDKIIATKKATTSDEFVHNIQTRGVKLFTTIEETYAALRNGQADAVLFDSTVILHYIETRGKNEFKTTGRLYSRQSYGFAFPAGSPLRDKVSIAVLELRESFKYAIIYSKWFGPYRR